MGTYQKSFDAVIDTLAGILENRDKAVEQWDGEIIVEHTTKAAQPIRSRTLSSG